MQVEQGGRLLDLEPGVFARPRLSSFSVLSDSLRMMSPVDNAAPQRIMVRFIGGPYGDDVLSVEAAEDPFGDPWPVLPIYRRHKPLPLGIPPAHPEPRSFDDRILTYYREHRGGQWVYVLAGADEATLPEETDPALEAFIAHVREHWPTRQIAKESHVVPAELRETFGAEFEEHLRKSLMGSLHAHAHEQDVMIVDVVGPDWLPGGAWPWENTFEVRAVGIPRFHGRKRQLGQPGSEQASA